MEGVLGTEALASIAAERGHNVHAHPSIRNVSMLSVFRSFCRSELNLLTFLMVY